jgi:hypothetical protein
MDQLVVTIKDLIRQGELINSQLEVLKYGKNQARLLINRIVEIINNLVLIKKVEHLQEKLQQLSNCLFNIKQQIQQYHLVNHCRFFYVIDNEQKELFTSLYGSLNVATEFLGLKFYIEHQEIAAMQDGIQDQSLINNHLLLLKDLLSKQLENFTDLSARVAFAYSYQLTLDAYSKIDLSWDQISDRECYNWLEQHNLLNISYEFLNPNFIAECSRLSLINRSCFINAKSQVISFKECWYLYPELQLNWISLSLKADLSGQNLIYGDHNNEDSSEEQLSETIPSLETSRTLSLHSILNSQDELNSDLAVKLEAATLELRQILSNNLLKDCSFKEYWKEYAELHEIWLKKLYELPSAIVAFSQSSIHSGNEPPYKKIKKISSSAKKIMEEQGFSLLQLNIPAPQEIDGGMQFFVAVTNQKAELLLSKPKITELDIEDAEIIDLFDDFKEISEKQLTQIKDYFQRLKFNMS